MDLAFGIALPQSRPGAVGGRALVPSGSPIGAPGPRPWGLPERNRRHATAMQHHELAELATLIAEHGPALVLGPARVAPGAINQYWLTSRYRFDAWGRVLKRFAGAVPPATHADPAHSVYPVIEEILAGEVLARVWTAVLRAYDRHRGQDEIEPLARGAYLGHLEARNRALALLMHAPGVRVEDAVALNRLRARTERWTDLLIGRLLVDLPPTTGDAAEFAADPQRARDFATDLREDGADGLAWSLTLAAMRASFREWLTAPAPHEGLNARIASAVLGCFPGELFDATGQFQSLWMLRMSSVAADTQGLVAALFDMETGGRPARRTAGEMPGRFHGD